MRATINYHQLQWRAKIHLDVSSTEKSGSLKLKDLGRVSIYADYTSGNFLTFGAVSDNSDFFFTVYNPLSVGDIYQLTDTVEANVLYDRSKDGSFCIYEDYHVMNGFLIMKRFDLQNRMVSGMFEFTTFNPDCGDTIKVTDGRFDIGEITY